MSDKVSKYNYPSSETGGVRPLSIRGVFENERLRLSDHFTDADRQWRKQWLKDQILSPNEPRPKSQEWIREVRNPIRRFLSKPWQLFEAGISPIVGKEIAAHARYSIARILLMGMASYVLWYHLKYNQTDWTRAYGPLVTMPKPVVFPGDKGFPAKRERFEPSDYYDRGFKSRKVFLD